MEETKNSNQYTIPEKGNLKSFIERIKRLSKKSNIAFDIRKILSEAKTIGYDPKIIRKILVLKKMDVDERLEQKALLDTYRNALGIN